MFGRCALFYLRESPRIISDHYPYEFLFNRLQEERNKNYTEKDMLSLLLGLGLLYHQNQIDDKDKQAQPMKLHYALGDYDVKELMRNVGVISKPIKTNVIIAVFVIQPVIDKQQIDLVK